MDERDYKAMNDELKKEQPSIELQISDEQLDKIKSCEVLKINGMEFISRTKTTEMLIKFANEQLKEKEDEIEIFNNVALRWRKKWESAVNLQEDYEKQLSKSNEMADRLYNALDIFNRADADSGLQTSILKHDELIFIRKALTEYQNSKK